MKRKFLVLALGLSFLIAVSWFGGLISNAAPHTPTAHIQTSQAGPYQVTLQIDPNPPLLTKPSTITIQLANSDHQAISDAHIFIDSTMETMDMGTARDEALPQSNGLYRANVQFYMSGPWKLLISISQPNQKTVTTTFEVTAQ
jgi:YtkA-like